MRCRVRDNDFVRVNPAFRLAMHIDTDEGNAGNLKTGTLGYIEEIQSRA